MNERQCIFDSMSPIERRMYLSIGGTFRRRAAMLAKHADDPDADPLTIEAQLRASADLLQAERVAIEERR